MLNPGGRRATHPPIDYDFTGLGLQTSVVCQSALRAKMLDDRVRDFIARHSDAVVVDLGAGLDSGFYRVAPPPSAQWYSVDLPRIMALRDDVLPADSRSHSVPVSLRNIGPTRFRLIAPPC